MWRHSRHSFRAARIVGSTGNALVREFVIPAIRKGKAAVHLHIVFCNLSYEVVMEILDALKENKSLVGFTCMMNFDLDDLEDAMFNRAAIETEAPLEVFQDEELPKLMVRARIALALVRGIVKARRPSDTGKSPLKYLTVDVARLIVDSLIDC
jgi:hypothetical protein